MALLPVRVETRFDRSEASPALLVRIYPDSILADSHEPLLTAAEADAGRAYWRRAFADGHERDAWTALLGVASAERAAWIVERTTPSNVEDRGATTEPVFAPIRPRPNNWHRAPEARGSARPLVGLVVPGQPTHPPGDQ